MATRFLAVSNLGWGGFQPSHAHPPEEMEFATLEQAVAWLRELKCGGAVSDYSKIIEVTGVF